MASTDGSNPNRSPRALPEPQVEWLPPTPRPDERGDFFERRTGSSEWRRRNRLPPSEHQPKAILAYPQAKRNHTRR